MQCPSGVWSLGPRVLVGFVIHLQLHPLLIDTEGAQMPTENGCCRWGRIGAMGAE